MWPAAIATPQPGLADGEMGRWAGDARKRMPEIEISCLAGRGERRRRRRRRRRRGRRENPPSNRFAVPVAVERVMLQLLQTENVCTNVT